jgi:hypothetical protein
MHLYHDENTHKQATTESKQHASRSCVTSTAQSMQPRKRHCVKCKEMIHQNKEQQYYCDTGEL